MVKGVKPEVEQGLPWSWKFAILVLAVLVFLFADGPIWEAPFRIDRQVYLSYLVIPILVVLAAVTRWELSGPWLFLDTLALVCAKFGLTCAIAVTLWAFSDGPRSYASAESDGGGRAARPPASRRQTPPVATRLATDRKADLKIDVAGLGGQEAFVFVQAGLEHLRFTVPPEVAAVQLGTRGLLAPLMVLQTWRSTRWSSLTSELHTAFGTDLHGRVVFNLPVLPDKRGTARRFKEPLGLVRVRCSVHKDGASRQERVAGHLLLLHHPFASVIRGDRRVVFRDVPKGELVVALWSRASGLRNRVTNHHSSSGAVLLGVERAAP